MAPKMFPAIAVSRRQTGFEAVAAVKLASILMGDLLLGQAAVNAKGFEQLNRLDPEIVQQDRECFLEAIAGWPCESSLELHLSVFPDLAKRSAHHTHATLIIRVLAADPQVAREAVLDRFLALMPQLRAHFWEVDFVPVTHKNELEARLHPFSFVHALAVTRREVQVNLSTPVETTSIGFGPLIVSKPDPNSVSHRFPWNPSGMDDSRLLRLLAAQIDPIHLICRFQPVKPEGPYLAELKAVVSACESFLGNPVSRAVAHSRQAELLRDVALRQLNLLLCAPCLRVGVFILAGHPIDLSIGQVLASAITAVDPKLLLAGQSCLQQVAAVDAGKGFYFKETAPYTIKEASCALRMPTPPLENGLGWPVQRFRTRPADLPLDIDSNNQGVSTLFTNRHNGLERPICLDVPDRLRHMFILGQTGTGKSTLMESMILQDIRAGSGVALIDPHGELVDQLLGRIPAERIDDVVLIDLLDRQRPVGMNLIEWKTIEERDLLIDEMYLTLDRIYDMRTTGGPIFESNFRGMLKLLMGDKPRKGFVPTVLEFPLCYLDNKFRRFLHESITDPNLNDFIEELERTGGEASLSNLSPYITSKFSRFSSDVSLRHIMGQEHTTFDIEKILAKGQILLVNLAKGRFGANLSALIANQIVSRFKLAAMKRGELPADERKPFYLYVDESHNLPAENFMELLAEARKYGLGLVLATQHTSQLKGGAGVGSNLLSAIVGNVGTTVIFRLGQEDAAQIGQILYPQFSFQDVLGLPNWNGYVRMQFRGQALPPFSFTTIKDNTTFDPALADAIRTHSRKTYGRSAKVVDRRIERRRTVWRNSESGEKPQVKKRL